MTMAYRLNRLWPRDALTGAIGRFAPVLLALSAIGLLWGGIVYHVGEQRDAVYANARQDGANLARIFEEQILRTVAEADQTLLYVRDAYARDPAAFDISLWRNQRQFLNGITFQVAIIGADGYLLTSNRGPAGNRVDLRDREHFQVHATSTRDALYISKPVFGRVSGRWSIQFTRRITLPNGRFGGVVVVSIDPAYLANFYQSIDIGPRTVVTLVGLDGVIRTQAPLRPGAIGRSLTGSALLTYVARSRSGDFTETATDGIKRLVSYRVVRGYPLVVAVGLDSDAIFAAHDREFGSYVTVGLLITVWIIVATLLIVRYQARLGRARDTAEASLRARSEFLAVMSHEIRTPVNAVLGLAATLLDTRLNDEQRTAVQTIHESGDSLLAILNDVLDLSKLEAGRMALESIAFAPEPLTRSALEIIATHAAAKGLLLDTDCADDLPPALRGDAARIRQVLLNLVSNAVKFTEAGSVTVAVRCLARDATTATVEWSVTDTGIGIPPERINGLFRDFVQADRSINRRFGGTGLGLSICKRLVEQMGGEISVSSVPAQGSTFRFRLTLPIAEEPSSTATREEETAYAELKIRLILLGRPLRVLIADDNATNRLVAARMLKDFDIQVSMAANGVEAVAAVTRFPCDLVLMDMWMPEMDGLAATRAIRSRDGAMADLPIVAMTANAFADDVQACRDAGMDEFVAKPVRKVVLIEAMLRALARRQIFARPPNADTLPPPADGPSAAPALAPAAAVDPVGETSTAEVQILDHGAFAEFRTELGDDAARQTFMLFRSDTARRLALMRRLDCATGRETIAQEAHALKGAAGIFGFTRLSGLAHALQLAAATLDEDDYRQRVAALEAAFDAAQEAFTAEIPLAA